MKIGILTFHKSDNYGAYLQAYALTMSLRKKYPDFDVELIDYDSKRAKKYYLKLILKEGKRNGFIYYLKRHMAFNRAAHDLPLSKDKCVTDDMDKFRKFIDGKYNIVIVGSDQIWKFNSFRGFPNAYWLPGKVQCAKFSYAASSRSNANDLSDIQRRAIVTFLEEYSYVGVRDQKTYDVLSALQGNYKIEKNCDPVFLHDFKFSKKEGREVLIKRFRINSKIPCIGLMTRDEAVIAKIREKFHENVNIVSFDIPHKGTKSNPNISPFEFAKAISGLDFMVTSFFHGLCVALKKNVPVVALEEKVGESRDNSKMLDVLNTLHLESLYIDKESSNYADLVTERVKSTLTESKTFDCSSSITELIHLSDSFFVAIDAFAKGRIADGEV